MPVTPVTPVWMIQRPYGESNKWKRIHQSVWLYWMIINGNGNIQHLSPSSHQLSPSGVLTAARRAAEWPNLSSQISSFPHLPCPNVRRALKRHAVSLPIHNHYLRAVDDGAKQGPRKRKGNAGECKTGGGGENKRCGSISDSPLALSYQSHWLAHVILLWFGSANQCAADSLPVTVRPLDKSWKIP